jgi:hypothetical protein
MNYSSYNRKGNRFNLKTLFRFNDDFMIIWFMIMFLAMLGPSIFVTEKFDSFRYAALIYVCVLALMQGFAFYVSKQQNLKRPIMMFERHDISSNLLRYFIVALLTIFVFFLMSSFDLAAAGSSYRSLVAALGWEIFVIGISEQIISVGLVKILKQYFSLPVAIFWMLVLMGLGHTTAYMILSGVTSFTPQLWMLLGGASFGFALFYGLYVLFKRDMVSVGIVHGLFNLAIKTAITLFAAANYGGVLL